MAVISHIPASESAFENGNRKFLISEILDFPDKKKQKKRLIFDGVFTLRKKQKITAIKYSAQNTTQYVKTTTQ